jgi:hypothetical protein
MQADSLDEALEALMADSRLVQLCEMQRTSDEVLDVINLTENQHSDILAWMFDPREGHGQGDEILRDFLVSASVAARTSPGEVLDGRASTSKFFQQWTPSRLRTASFGTAFTARELGMSAADRVDLFVVDEHHKFILLIENKAGTAHGDAQLDRYVASYQELVKSNPRLREFSAAYIALDRDYDVDAEVRASEKRWLHIGYDWLKTSATRAQMHVQRGNSAARLVVSYCERQTGWDSDAGTGATKMAAELHHAHPDALQHLLGFSRGRLEKEWLTRHSDEHFQLFLLQNRAVVSILRETQGMAAVQASIQGRLTWLPKSSVEYYRSWLAVCPTGWETLGGDDYWPVMMTVRFSDGSKTKFKLSVTFVSENARTEAEAETLRARLIDIEPRFERWRTSAARSVEVADGLTLAGLLEQLVRIDEKFQAALKRDPVTSQYAQR